MLKTLSLISLATLFLLVGCGTQNVEPQKSVTRQAPVRPAIYAPAVEVSQVVSQPEAAIPTVQATARPAPTPMAEPVPKAPRELATHETEFNAKEKNRSNNITRAAAAIDGHIVQPGEVFSYNETVGPTNEKRGYKKGIIFIKGEKAEGVGGGVCQVSTTLYNATANAGLTILERHDHSRPVTYAEEGDEAATSFGGIDFKFKNEKPFPIRINASVKEGTISVTISEI